MSELQEQSFGLESVERSAGYIPAVVDMPKEPQGEEISRTELENVAAEVSAGRDEQIRNKESRPYDSEIAVVGKDGVRRPDNETLSIEEASHLVTGARNQSESVEDWEQRNALAAEIDALRNGVTTEQLQAEPPPVAQHPQVQEQPQPIDNDWQKHLQDPRLLNAVAQHTEQVTAQANAAAQAYNQAAMEACDRALIGLCISYPELKNITPQQLPVALEVIGKQNPQRCRDIIDHIGLINDTVKRGVEARQQQSWAQFAHYQKQFNTWGKAQDAEYEAYASQAVSPAERQSRRKRGQWCWKEATPKALR
jgi:hypothetical protein